MGNEGKRRVWPRVLGAGCALVIAVGVVEVLRFHGSVSALSDAQHQLKSAQHDLTSLTSDPSAATLQRLDSELDAAQRDLGPRSSAIGNAPELDALGSLPFVGRQVRGVRQMRTTAADAVSVAQLAMPAAQALVAPTTDTGGAHQNALQRLVAAVGARPTLDADVDRAVARLRADLTALRADDVWGLGGTRATVLADGTRLADQGTSAVEAVTAVHTALAGTHRYLLLLGNPAEIRPGGGFIGVIGTIDTQDGAVTKSSFTDPNALAAKVRDQPIPRPLDAYLFHGVPWDIADANWSADFPSSARQVETFWSEAQHQQVDGVISIDTTAIAKLLKVLGPVHTPGYPQVITSSNVLTELTDIANRIRPGDPGKPFLSAFGSELVHRLENVPAAQTGAIVHALSNSVPGRHLSLYAGAASVQSVVAEHQLSGALAAPAAGSDQLLVSDANLSGGKNDLFVTRAVAAAVTVTKGGAVHHVVSLRYTQPVPADAEQRALQPGSGGAYRDYIQLFVPAGAQLTSVVVDGKPGSPEDISTTGGLTDIALFTIVSPGQTRSISVSYDTTPAAPVTGFTLLKPLQALPHPADVTVTWANGKVAQRLVAAADADVSLHS